MELFGRVILWILLMLVAIAVGAAVARSNTERAAAPLLVRTRWLWLGVVLVVGGIVATFSGFGWAWTASMEDRSQVPGMVLFMGGLVATFGGAGMLAGRAIRYVRAERSRRGEAGVENRRVRPLAVAALLSFVAGQVYLALYLGRVLSGGAAAALAGVLVPPAMVASWVLGYLALRATARRGAATAFLFVAPWPILVLHMLIVMFAEVPGVYLVIVATAVVVACLALGLGFSGERMRTTVYGMESDKEPLEGLTPERNLR